MNLVLPFPPSINSAWCQRAGRIVSSDEAKRFRRVASQQAREQLEEQQAARFDDGELEVTIDLFRPIRVGDLDNYIKTTLDALQGIAFADDGQISELHARRHDSPQRPRVEVRIVRIEPAQMEMFGAE